MLKEEDIFEEEEEKNNRVSRYQNRNLFLLPDQIKNNINKRLPRGFCLMKAVDAPQNQPFQGQIEYVPKKRDVRIASQQLAKQFVIQTQLPNSGRRESRVEDKGLRFGQLPEGKSKHGQKIKMIIQRFRKHQRYTTFLQHLTRLGFANALNQIQNQNRKNIHTIESFKERTLFLFQKALEVTYQPDKVTFINQMIDEIQFLVENAQKAQFTTSLGFIQKSIDKVTRQISDIRQTGSYYYRRKKRNEKSYDEKEILYIAELIKHLPPYEMVGVIEIIEEKPFAQMPITSYTFDLNTLKHKKIRQIEFYVKKKLSCFYRSRERKQMKIELKQKLEKQKNQSKKQNPEDNRKQSDIEFIFEEQDNRGSRRKLEQGQPEISIEPFCIASQSHFEHHNEQNQHDDLFGEHEASRRSSPISVIREESNVMDFQPLEPRPISQIHKSQKEPQQKSQNESNPLEQFDSDSSYITDEEESDF